MYMKLISFESNAELNRTEWILFLFLVFFLAIQEFLEPFLRLLF